jgi:hypothetical protein
MEVSCQLYDPKALFPPLQSRAALGTNLDESHNPSRGFGEDRKILPLARNRTLIPQSPRRILVTITYRLHISGSRIEMKKRNTSDLVIQHRLHTSTVTGD